MPRSSREELAALREEVFARDGRCVWPGCADGPLQLVHLHHRGMGGQTSVNIPEECVTMCRTHHDIYDGRIVGSYAREEWAALFRYLAGIRS